MTLIVARLAETAAHEQKQSVVEHLNNIGRMLDRNLTNCQPDWDEVAVRWLDVIRPVWFEMLTRRKRSRPLRLRDIRTELLARDQWLTGEILDKFREFPILPGPEERIKACILGVG